MKKLPSIYELDANRSSPRNHFRQRIAARAVVFDAHGRIALLHVAKNAYHKLPGGGIDPGEDVLTALRREMLEEIGCDIAEIQEIGEITEYRDEWGLTQVSYFYRASVDGQPGTPDFTEEEVADGFEVVWADNIGAAIARLQANQPQGYEGPLIQQRDIAILQAVKIMESSND